MSGVVHFGIYVDDIERAKKFYGDVFGWSFMAHGPPDFALVDPHGGSEFIRGAVQARHYAPVPDKVLGYECTIAVPDVDAAAAAIEAHGGKIVMPRAAVPGVGWLVKFLDTEGNLACAMHFDETAA